MAPGDFIKPFVLWGDAMALRDQPYLPLYVKDVLSDEKLAMCSPEAHGVYFLLLCILHKQKVYGKILPRQNGWQKNEFAKCFAKILAKQMPFDLPIIERSLIELAEEGVIILTGKELSQKRMVKDGELSLTRSINGKKGAYATHGKNFAMAKGVANDLAKDRHEF